MSAEIKRILYICGGELDFGGITTWIYNYISHINRSRFIVDIICFGYKRGEREKDFEKLNIKIFHVPYLRDNIIKNYSEIRKIITNGNYDIIHSHLEAMNMYSLWIASKSGVKARISHSHGTNHYTSNRIKARMYNIIKKRINKYSTLNMSCSIASGRWMYGQKDFTVIPNAIDYKRFKFCKEERNYMREKYNITDKIVIGTVGHMNVIKNQIFMIEVVKRLNNKDIVFVIVGDGEEKEHINNKIKEYNMGESVLFMPPSHNVEKYYNMFDIFVIPSLHEGLSLVTIEAQVSGLPVIASDGIPNEARISSSYMNIELKYDIWIRAINRISECNLTIKRNNVDDLDKTYDIDNCINILESIYDNM